MLLFAHLLCLVFWRHRVAPGEGLRLRAGDGAYLWCYWWSLRAPQPMHSVCSASSPCFSWEAVVRWHTPQPGKVNMEFLSVKFIECHLVMWMKRIQKASRWSWGWVGLRTWCLTGNFWSLVGKQTVFRADSLYGGWVGGFATWGSWEWQ